MLILPTMQMNTPFVSGDTPLTVITFLENAAEKLFKWFANNHMKANHDECHLLMGTLTPISIKIKDYIIRNSDNEKLLGVTVSFQLLLRECADKFFFYLTI